MTTISRLVPIIGLFASSLVLPALAKDDGPKHTHRSPFGNGQLLPPPLVEQLQLTATQRAEYDRLQARWNEARDQHRNQHQEQMQKLRRELRSAREAGDEARLRAIREQIAKILQPQIELRQQLIQQFRATLTLEQQSILDTARERARQRMNDRRERRDHKRVRPG